MKKILIVLGLMLILATLETFSQTKTDEYQSYDFVRNYLVEFIDEPIKCSNVDNELETKTLIIKSIKCKVFNIDSEKCTYSSDILLDYNPLIENIEIIIDSKWLNESKKITKLEVYNFTNDKFYDLDEINFSYKIIDDKNIILLCFFR